MNRSTLCLHERFQESRRTWEVMASAGGMEFEFQISHRQCLTCRALFGKELWETKRQRGERQ